MIDNAQALLLPFSIFVLIFIYYLFRKFTKPKKNTVSHDKKTETETDLKNIEHTETGIFEKIFDNLIVVFAVLFFLLYILVKTENKFFKEILETFNQTKKTNTLGLDSEEYKYLLKKLQEKQNQDKTEDDITK